MSANSKAQRSRFSVWWEQKNFGKQAIGAFKTGLAAMICVWLGNLLGLERSYWAAVSAIFPAQWWWTSTESCLGRPPGARPPSGGLPGCLWSFGGSW